MGNADAPEPMLFLTSLWDRGFEKKRKRALWFWTKYWERIFFAQNKDINWILSEGTFKKHFHSILTAGYSWGTSVYKAKLNLFILAPESVLFNMKFNDFLSHREN